MSDPRDVEYILSPEAIKKMGEGHSLMHYPGRWPIFCEPHPPFKVNEKGEVVFAPLPTLEEAVRVLNEHKHGGWSWEIEPDLPSDPNSLLIAQAYCIRESGFRCEVDTLTPFECRAIAAAYLSGQDET